MANKKKKRMRSVAQLNRVAGGLRNLKAVENLKGYTKEEKDWLHSELKRRSAAEIKKQHTKILRKLRR